MSDTMTPTEIRACIEAGDFTLYGVEDADDWEVNLTGDHDTGALIAFARHYTSLMGSTSGVDWYTFLNNFTECFKEQWDSPGAFARNKAEDDADTYGKPDERKAKREFLREYADVIDWEAVVDRPTMAGYVMVKAARHEGDHAVYVFKCND
jgi:hypothetical protein